MICKVCNTKTSGYKKIKRGKICKNCYDALPACIQNSIRNLTSDEICCFGKKFHTSEQFVEQKHYTPWLSYHNLSLTLSGILLEEKHILLFKDLQSVWFSFIPRKYENQKLCFGDLCLHFVFHGIPYEFSTLAAQGTIPIPLTAHYAILPNDRKDTEPVHRNGNHSASHTIEEEKAKYERYQEKYKFWQEENRREQQRKEQEKRERQKQSDRTKNTQKQTQKDELHQALDFFHLRIPFSKQELKTIYRKYMRQCHPDQKQKTVTFTAAQVNVYYGTCF